MNDDDATIVSARDPIRGGTCFLCGAEATLVHFYHVARGHFAVGKEPRTCRACSDRIDQMSDEDVGVLLAGFDLTDESDNPIDVARRRGLS